MARGSARVGDRSTAWHRARPSLRVALAIVALSIVIVVGLSTGVETSRLVALVMGLLLVILFAVERLRLKTVNMVEVVGDSMRLLPSARSVPEVDRPLWIPLQRVHIEGLKDIAPGLGRSPGQRLWYEMRLVTPGGVRVVLDSMKQPEAFAGVLEAHRRAGHLAADSDGAWLLSQWDPTRGAFLVKKEKRP